MASTGPKTVACPPPLKPAAEKAFVSPEEMESAITEVLELGRAHFVSQCLYTVVTLGVPDVIGAGTLSFAEIVSALGCTVNEDLLLRQLRLVAAAGVLNESAGEAGGFMYSLAPMGKLLQTGVPQPSMACGVKCYLEPPMWAAWSKLPEATFADGDDPFRAANGLSFYDYLRGAPAAAQAFNEFMTFYSHPEVKAVAEEYDWAPFRGKILCDVGGGYGSVMAAVKSKYPEIRTLSFDLPEVINAISEPPEGVELVRGSFFDHTTIPSCDVAFLKHIFHNWSDESSSKILGSLHLALPAHAKLVIADSILPGVGPDDPTTIVKKKFNCFMALFTGKQRTLKEWEALLSASSWVVEGVIEKTSGGPLCSFITAHKA